MIDKESETVETYLDWAHKGGTSLIQQNKDNTEESEVDRERERAERNKTTEKKLCAHQGLAMPEISATLGFPAL